MTVDLTLVGSASYELESWADSPEACEARKFLVASALIAFIPFALLETITRLAIGILLSPCCSSVACDIFFQGSYETIAAIPMVFSRLFCSDPREIPFQEPHLEMSQGPSLTALRSKRVQRLVEKNEWVRNALTTAKGNSSLADARIVLLADTNHASDQVQQDMRRFVGDVSENADIFLIEGYQCLKPFPHSHFPYLSVYGWDDDKLRSQGIQNILKSILISYECYKLSKQLEPPKSLSGRLSGILPGAKEKHKKLQQEAQKKSNQMMMLEEQSTNEIILKGRNCSLLHAVQTAIDHTPSHRKIFVHAGADHYSPEVLAKLESQPHIVVTFQEASPPSAEFERNYTKQLILNHCDVDKPTRAILDEMFDNYEFVTSKIHGILNHLH